MYQFPAYVRIISCDDDHLGFLIDKNKNFL